MEEIQLLDAVERYLNNEMNAEERAFFEQLRSSNSAVDQMVVEQTIFLQKLQQHGAHKQFRIQLNEVHHQLEQAGSIKTVVAKTRIIDMWRKYRRVVAVAATIAGVIALATSGLVTYFAPSNNKQVEELASKLNTVIKQQNANNSIIKDVQKSLKAPVGGVLKSGGTSFLIDSKGYLVTNAHVIKNSTTVIVQNNKGDEFKVTIVHKDNLRDIAILKITDEDFKPLTNLPYGLKRNGADLGEQIFTLGFPREEIVYGEGYMSARTGYNGDTMSCQIAVAANPGNSGGPVFNKQGEVVGILSTRLQAQGAVFAVTTKNIFRTIEELKKEDTAFNNLKLTTISNVKNMAREQQIKKIEDCIFLVKTY